MTEGLPQKGQDQRPGVFIKTFGCQMNEYDSQKLFRILENRFQPVSEPEQAELVIVNTCSVRDKPEQKLYSYLGELRELRRQNPRLRIGVGGCVAQQEGQRIVARSPGVDFVFGTHNLSLVPGLLAQREAGAPPQVAVNYRDEWEELPLGFGQGYDRVSAFVSISRGCNKNCTYCIVPTTRGPEVSRSLDEVVREVKIAAHRGTREIVLLGQTVNSYGRDFNPRRSFVELLEAVADVPGIERIRFTSPHPQEIRKDFIDLVVRHPKICRHVHLPLQSGSDRILKAMNRNYRRKRYLGIVSALKEQVPDMAITTDIIVGFPGESRQDFEETLAVMRTVAFDASYSFMFSPRPGTVAAALEDTVCAEDKLSRLQELQRLQDEIQTNRLASWIGQEAELLIDRPSASNEKLLQGRISQNIVVNLNREEPELKPGRFAQVRITGAARHTLHGEVVAVLDR